MAERQISKRARGALVAGAVAAVAIVPAVSGAATPVKLVTKVRDFAFKPAKAKVPRNSTIVWKWPSSSGGAPHNVTLKQRPAGVKRFHSLTKTANYTYKHKLTVKGKYVFICTIHPFMRQTITVR